MDLPDDPLVRSLLPDFCREWEADLDERWWPRVRAARDAAELRRLGHTVKGSFAQYGAPGGDLGEALMRDAAAEDWAGADRDVATIRERLAELRRSVTIDDKS